MTEKHIEYIKNNWNWEKVSTWQKAKIIKKMSKELNIDSKECNKVYRAIMDLWCTGKLKRKDTWSEHDLSLLKRLATTGGSNLYISKTLKTYSPQEVRIKRALLNLPTVSEFTNLELEELKKLDANGDKTSRSLAVAIGREVGEIRKYYKNEPRKQKQKPQLTKWAEHEEIKKMLKAGYKRKIIAARFNKNIHTLHAYLIRHGLQQTRSRKVTTEILQGAKEFRLNNWSWADIAKHYNINYCTLYNFCRSRGIV